MGFRDAIRFFRDCYEADNKRTTIWNIFHPSVEHRVFTALREELVTGFLAELPLDLSEGQAIKKAAYLYRREKELIYSSAFIVGWVEVQEEVSQAVCAPLLMYPAEITEAEESVFLRVDLHDPRLNRRLLDCLMDGSDGSRVAERISGALGDQSLTFDRVVAAADILESLVPGLDASEMARYPELISENELAAAFADVKVGQRTRLKILPASVLALVKKSTEIRGVLDELAEVAVGECISEPLQALFGEGAGARSAAPGSQVGRVPAVLSRAQTQIIKSASTTPLTLVIGPPGTGKSYTIAALAVDHLSRGKSVLIASKMNHAVDVVGNKIEEQLGLNGCVVRGGRKQYLKDLKLYLSQLLNGMYTTEPFDKEELVLLTRETAIVDSSLDQVEREIVRSGRQEIGWGRFLANTGDGFTSRLRSRYIRWRVQRSQPLWDLLNLMEQHLAERVRKSARLIKLLHQERLTNLLLKHRPDFTRFLAAIRARTGGKQEDLFNAIDFEVLLSAFPVWLCNLSDIHELLPLRCELFDLAIIDEATQCDIASSLPVLQRAKRVVIVGDPHQLRHLSFLSVEMQQSLSQKHGLSPQMAEAFDYRAKSILDLVNENIDSQDHVSFLNEHYRSAPPIIAFSNQTFYGGKLHIMTDKPGDGNSNRLVLRRGAGDRRQTGENRDEADCLIEDVVRQVDSEREVDRDLCHSLGVLSPFRSQVDYISERLSRRLPLEDFQRHDLLVGTAHSFQGEERDIMFLSFAVGNNSHRAALRFLERPDVFNVSITRARSVQYVYVSFDAGLLEPGTLLAAYLRFAGSLGNEVLTSGGKSQAESADAFASNVAEQLRAAGFEVWTTYSVAGLTMDLVIAREENSCGIDLVGYPGEFEAPFPLERYRMFHRAGLKIVPLPYSRWLLDRVQCLEAIEAAVRSRPGFPRKSGTTSFPGV
ncbi:MAG TPA: AAA domain-containing protein [Blastocatellia bacterium]|nr:AAA domain-containing protein [Blastocatellia bacterium]